MKYLILTILGLTWGLICRAYDVPPLVLFLSAMVLGLGATLFLRGLRNPIRTDADHEVALEEVDELLRTDPLNEKQMRYLEQLSDWILEWEKVHFPMGTPTCKEMVNYLADNCGLTTPACLTEEEYLAVMDSPKRGRLIIGGAVREEDVVLWTGDFMQVTVPKYYFDTMSDICPKPDFNKLSICDYGHTVALGDYEAAIEPILERYF